MLKAATDLMQTVLISEMVTVIVMFLQKIQESAPLTKLVAYPIEIMIGLGMLIFAFILFMLNIIFYPFNWVWNMVMQYAGAFLGRHPILDLRNLYRPLGWD